MKPTYAETAKKCLDRLGQYNLSMKSFSDVNHIFGTSFCMLGDLVEQERLLVRMLVRPADYCREELGFSLTSNLGAWLFSFKWSSDIELAKARCKIAIDLGQPPAAFNPEKPLAFKYFERALKDY